MRLYGFGQQQPQPASGGLAQPAGGYSTVGQQGGLGGPRQVYAPGSARKTNDRGAYDPYANDELRTSSNMAGGVAGAAEMVGTASKYRTPGYQVDRTAGLAGGSVDNSNAWIDYQSALAAQARAGMAPYNQAFAGGLGQAAQARDIQQQAANSYLATLNGQNPSLAQLQLQQGLQAQQAAQASMAAGARGGGANLAAAQLGGAMMAGQQGAGLNQQAAMLRAQEIQGAQQGLAGVGGQMRAQDYGQAGLGLQGLGMQQNDALAYEKLRQNQQLGELNAQTALEQQQGELALRKQQQNAQEEQTSAQAGKSIFGMSLGALGGLFG